jgi:exopolysaccharide production protein ExoQ
MTPARTTAHPRPSMAGAFPGRRDDVRPAADLAVPGSRATGGFATAVLVLSTGAFFAVFRGGGGAAEGSDPLILLLWVAAYLVAGVALLDGGLRLRLPVRVPVSLLAFVALAAGSVLWSVAAEVTLRRTFGLVGTVLVGLLLAHRLAPVEILDAVRRAMLIVAVASLLLWAVGDPRVIDPVHDSLRGVVATKNTLGRVMGLGLLAAATSAFIDRGRTRRALLSAAPMVLALALTDSAGGALIAVMILVLMLIASLWAAPSGRVFLGGAAFLALGGIALVLPTTTADDVVALLGRDLTITGRTEIWQLSFDALAQRPFLGFGYGAFWHEDGAIEAARIAALLYWPVPNAHNGLLDVALDLGVVGAVVALVVVTVLLAAGVRDLRAGRRQAGVLRMAIGLLVVVSNLVESSFLQENAFLTVVFVAALAARQPDPWPQAGAP